MRFRFPRIISRSIVKRVAPWTKQRDTALSIRAPSASRERKFLKSTRKCVRRIFTAYQMDPKMSCGWEQRVMAYDFRSTLDTDTIAPEKWEEMEKSVMRRLVRWLDATWFSTSIYDLQEAYPYKSIWANKVNNKCPLPLTWKSCQLFCWRYCVRIVGVCIYHRRACLEQA